MRVISQRWGELFDRLNIISDHGETVFCRLALIQ